MCVCVCVCVCCSNDVPGEFDFSFVKDPSAKRNWGNGLPRPFRHSLRGMLSRQRAVTRLRESIAVREAFMERLQCHLANDNTPALMWVDEEDGFEEDDEVSERQRSRLHMQATTVLQLYKLWNEREQAQLASLEHQPGSTHEEKGQGVQEVGGDDGTAREVFQNIQVFAEEAGKMLVPPIHGRTVQDYHSEWVANAERSESGDGCFNMDRRGKAECVWILDEEDKKRQ